MATTVDPTPVPKVANPTVAGALTAIIVWVLHETTSFDLPPEVAVASTTVITFVVGYVSRNELTGGETLPGE